MIDGNGIQVVTPRGTVVSADAMHAVDHLLDMQKRLPKWQFIALIISVWAKRDPEMAKSYQSRGQNEFYRGEMRNKHAASQDMGMRKMIDVPQKLWDTIGFFYPDEVREKKFIKDFANEFPAFRVSENRI